MMNPEFISAEAAWQKLVEAQIAFRDQGEAPPLMLDVRSTGEFSRTQFPFSVCEPILDDQERHLVGLEYKQKGQAAAIALGHQLVAGLIREKRVERWMSVASQSTAMMITCWRGGLRSQTAQDWLKEKDIHLPRVRGGTKALRTIALQTLENIQLSDGAVVLAGPTGSGKTQKLRELEQSQSDWMALDLEALACHRGSAFGALPLKAQPSQPSFEIQIALHMAAAKALNKKLIFEDESRMIGQCTIPRTLYNVMEELPRHHHSISLIERMHRIHQDYFLAPLEHMSREAVLQEFLRNLQKIERRLGGDRFQEIKALRLQAFETNDESFNLQAIEKLLVWYYDPLYERSLKRTCSKTQNVESSLA
jgi:tRNA 2-selenouridine synthase